MAKYDRLLCHPYRVFVNEICDSLVNDNGHWEYKAKQDIVIPVDSFVGNPDPYVFHKPWLYGYCRNSNFPNDTGPGTIIIFGTYLKDSKNQESFLVDTVFIVSNRYDWLGAEDNYLPSKTFRDNFQYTIEGKLYKDFLIHRVENGHHLKAKAIFAAKHADSQAYNDLTDLPQKRNDELYSFIPLKYENGVYNLIDILPIIKTGYPNLFDDYIERRNRLYGIDFIVTKAIDYLVKNANRLVLNTSGQGMPKELDMELQRKYFKRIYNITDNSKIEKCIKEICCSKLKDLED